jgi:hypothetical protein
LRSDLAAGGAEQLCELLGCFHRPPAYHQQLFFNKRCR